ncbi:MAG: ergothioneine biosynthesis protein EgtB [Actinomycetota bacterium]|jgi:ergothioneine biosynthesis protein EgtB|nr:ergothioneine biosynthesis protein EgtB [Actinomycetota bacterium]
MNQADPNTATDVGCLALSSRYDAVRALTERLAAPLSPEDQTVQSMPDVSPTKWHRGHTSWFFETFLLKPFASGYREFDPSYPYIFNSYYEAVGSRHPRADRGLISRPGARDVSCYRSHVDERMIGFLSSLEGTFDLADVEAQHTVGRRVARSGESFSRTDHFAALGALGKVVDLVELGLNHEQQHQELLLMDIKHVLWCNPNLPAYTSDIAVPSDTSSTRGSAGGSAGSLAQGSAGAIDPVAGWIEHPGGLVEIGHTGNGFAFDNESPRHVTYASPFALADRPVTCGDWCAFIDDGGYRRPELWLSDGWGARCQFDWTAPLYWTHRTRSSHSEWSVFTLGGLRPLEPDEPVCHVSYYEADAFARWAGVRLPTEVEWEMVAGSLLGDAARSHPLSGWRGATRSFGLHPRSVSVHDHGHVGDVWEWTLSAYSPYPGFKPAPGAVGEYNGKFMVNQHVLRGGSCVTPPGHVRPTYRNFFPPAARWPFTGVRTARDLEPGRGGEVGSLPGAPTR